MPLTEAPVEISDECHSSRATGSDRCRSMTAIVKLDEKAVSRFQLRSFCIVFAALRVARVRLAARVIGNRELK